jgi:hypothetical protein
LQDKLQEPLQVVAATVHAATSFMQPTMISTVLLLLLVVYLLCQTTILLVSCRVLPENKSVNKPICRQCLLLTVH